MEVIRSFDGLLLGLRAEVVFLSVVALFQRAPSCIKGGEMRSSSGKRLLGLLAGLAPACNEVRI